MAGCAAERSQRASRFGEGQRRSELATTSPSRRMFPRAAPKANVLSDSNNLGFMGWRREHAVSQSWMMTRVLNGLRPLLRVEWLRRAGLDSLQSGHTVAVLIRTGYEAPEARSRALAGVSIGYFHVEVPEAQGRALQSRIFWQRRRTLLPV